SGLDVNNLSLNRIIEELNNQDKANALTLFRDSQVEPSSANLDLYQQTMMVRNAIPSLPAETLGVVDDQSLTLRNIYQAGIRVAISLQTQGQTVVATSSTNFNSYSNRDQRATYEALMTAPRADMGDKLSKAFSNMDGMLEEMGVSLTELNKKAARILAYNNMEINPEEIDRIAKMDEKLTSVLKQMQPETVLGMIRDQVNPLEMGLDELSIEINKQQEKNGKSQEEKYSEFLVKLDSGNQITAKERESYIGIYRLINAVTSFSDRDLGSVMKNEQEVTLKNLLASHRSRNASNADYAIDDNFGMLESATREGKNIIEQVMSAFAENADEAEIERDEQMLKNLAEVSKESIELLKKHDLPYTPAYLAAAEQVSLNSGEFYQGIKDQLKIRNSSNSAFEDLEQKILDSIEADLSGDAASQVLASSEIATDTRAAANVARDIGAANMTKDTEAANVAKDTIAANELADTSAEAKLINDLENADDIADVLSPAEIYNDNWFVNAFADAFHENDAELKFTARDLQAGTMIHNMMRVANGMRQDHNYMIPIAINDEVLTMNLSFNKDTNSAVKMQTSVETRFAGRVESALINTADGLRLEIGVADEEAYERVSFVAGIIAEELSQSGVSISDVNLVTGALSLSTYADEGESDISSKTLYEAAKSLVSMIRRI
nr:DUF6240 domain-containing protein [Lachnospiraceae bacterium]